MHEGIRLQEMARTKVSISSKATRKIFFKKNFKYVYLLEIIYGKSDNIFEN